MGVASLILGIISLVLNLFGGLGGVGLIMAVLGIIFGAVGMKNPAKKGVATAGLVISIISAVWGGIVFIACAGACASLM